jgi:hypothetical protein
MPAIRSAVVVTAIWLIATGTYFALSDDVLPRLTDGQTKTQILYKDHIAELRAQVDRMSAQFLHNQQAEQQLTALLNARVDRIEQLGQHISALTDLSTAGTIKQDRIDPPIASDFAAPSNNEARSKSRELPATATTKQRKSPRAAHQHARLRHISAAEPVSPQASPVGKRPQSSQSTSMTIIKPHAGITDQ